ncbi:hypothetical protein DFH05DRAFT_683810 [Lentinula detonsa]|uniref:Uncharacterized protein n=1 Tax=Lentinula detonsa TaxID=2804962 RepID=A0A9W8P971_9AGAR|nr:hypothetical protein DFH05DRAFT_683810 [Lentinula detonsa]
MLIIDLCPWSRCMEQMQCSGIGKIYKIKSQPVSFLHQFFFRPRLVHLIKTRAGLCLFSLILSPVHCPSLNPGIMQHSYTRRSPWLFMLVLKLVLLAIIAGVCTASPLPQGNTVKEPEPSARSKGLKDRIFGHYNIGPKEVILGYAWMKEKTTDRVTPTEILEAELSSIASHSTSHASATASSGSSTNSPEDAARKAIEKLKTLSDILEAMSVSDGSRTVKYNYFFPSPNYFDVMVPGVSTSTS